MSIHKKTAISLKPIYFFDKIKLFLCQQVRKLHDLTNIRLLVLLFCIPIYGVSILFGTKEFQVSGLLLLTFPISDYFTVTIHKT